MPILKTDRVTFYSTKLTVGANEYEYSFISNLINVYIVTLYINEHCQLKNKATYKTDNI